MLPSQVYLQSLSAAVADAARARRRPTTTATTTAGASGFSATGVASSHVRVALVLDRLARLPWLSNVTLVSSTSSAPATSGTLSAGDTFSVTAGFNPNGGAK